MTMLQAANRIVEYNQNRIKFTVRRVFRMSNESDRLSGLWVNNLSDKITSIISDTANYVDGCYSTKNIAVAAMNETNLKIKECYI